MPSAAGRERKNHGETMPLTAAALMAPQPAPLSTHATKKLPGHSAGRPADDADREAQPRDLRCQRRAKAAIANREIGPDYRTPRSAWFN